MAIGRSPFHGVLVSTRPPVPPSPAGGDYYALRVAGNGTGGIVGRVDKNGDADVKAG